jgi:formate dehydrogenase major subunit
VQMCWKAIEPPGSARPDWQITTDLAKRIIALGGRDIRPASQSGWEYPDTSSVMTEVSTVTPSYCGVTHARLDAGERLQWPVLGPDHCGTPILHVGQFYLMMIIRSCFPRVASFTIGMAGK